MEQQKKTPISTKKKWPLIGGIIMGVVIIAAIVVIIVFASKDRSGDANNSGNGGASVDTNTSSDKASTAYKQVVCPTVDKYTNCVKNYVGLNASDSCTWRMNGNCMDTYGNGNINILFVTNDGQDINEANISNYKVVAQSVDPGAEIKYTYETESDGTESDWTESQNIDSITLNVDVIDASKQLVTKNRTGQMKRYECEAKDNGQVLDVVTVDTGTYSDTAFDVVNCQYTETVLE